MWKSILRRLESFLLRSGAQMHLLQAPRRRIVSSRFYGVVCDHDKSEALTVRWCLAQQEHIE